MPNYSTLLLGGNGFTIRLTDTIFIRSKTGLRILGGVAGHGSAGCIFQWDIDILEGCNRVWMLGVNDPIPTGDLRVIYVRPDGAQGKFSAWWFEDGEFKSHVIDDNNQTYFHNQTQTGVIANREQDPWQFYLVISRCGYTPKDGEFKPHVIDDQTYFKNLTPGAGGVIANQGQPQFDVITSKCGYTLPAIDPQPQSIMFDVKGCGGLVIENCQFICSEGEGKKGKKQALKGISLDQDDSSGSMTDSFIRRVSIACGGSVGLPGIEHWVGLHIANNSGANCEEIRIEECAITGPSNSETEINKGYLIKDTADPNKNNWHPIPRTIIKKIVDYKMTVDNKSEQDSTHIPPNRLYDCKIEDDTHTPPAIYQANFTPDMKGWIITVPCAGSHSATYNKDNPNEGMLLNSVVDNVPSSSTELLLRNNAFNSVPPPAPPPTPANPHPPTPPITPITTRARSLGTGIKVGDPGGGNAFGIRISGFNIGQCGTGIWVENGNVYCENGFTGSNDVDFGFRYGEQLKTIRKVHSEAAYQFFRGSARLIVEGCRIGGWVTPPEVPIVQINGISEIQFNQNTVECQACDYTMFGGNECNSVLMMLEDAAHPIPAPIPTVSTADSRVIYVRRDDDQGKFSAWWFDVGEFKSLVINENYQAYFQNYFQNQDNKPGEITKEIANREQDPKQFDLVTLKCGYTQGIPSSSIIVQDNFFPGVEESQLNIYSFARGGQMSGNATVVHFKSEDGSFKLTPYYVANGYVISRKAIAGLYTQQRCNRVLLILVGDTAPIPTVSQTDSKDIYIRPNHQDKFSAWWFEDGEFKPHVIDDDGQTYFKNLPLTPGAGRVIANREIDPKQFDLVTSKCGYTPQIDKNSIDKNSNEITKPRHLISLDSRTDDFPADPNGVRFGGPGSTGQDSSGWVLIDRERHGSKVGGNFRVPNGSIQYHKKIIKNSNVQNDPDYPNYKVKDTDQYLIVDASHDNIIITLPINELAFKYLDGPSWLQEITIVRIDDSTNSHTVQIMNGDMDDNYDRSIIDPNHNLLCELASQKYVRVIPVSAPNNKGRWIIVGSN